MIDEVGGAYYEGRNGQRGDEAQHPDERAAQLREDRPKEGDDLDEREEGREEHVEPREEHQPAGEAEDPLGHLHPRRDLLEHLGAALAAVEQVEDLRREHRGEAHAHQVARATEHPEAAAAAAELRRLRELVPRELARLPQGELLLLLLHAAPAPADHPERQEALQRLALLVGLQCEHRGEAVGDVLEARARVPNLGVGAGVVAVHRIVEVPVAPLVEGRSPAPVLQGLLQPRLGGDELAALRDELLRQHEGPAVLHA
mmetsp:Transcript_90055/g.280287  ORF Transcript_90055/g.280287 Transcript_90055/m.280287 type:complete len:258 (-) Transcript_90055:767-1540(-)